MGGNKYDEGNTSNEVPNQKSDADTKRDTEGDITDSDIKLPAETKVE